MTRHGNVYSPTRSTADWSSNTINELKWLKWLNKQLKRVI